MRWLCLLFLLVAAAALAANEFTGAETAHYAGIEVMTFQQGVSPTPSYSGCEDVWLDGDASTTNRNGSSLKISTTTASSVIKFDISAIPDDAVIHYAELRLQMTAEGSGSGTDALIELNRVMRNWDEANATWEKRLASADSTWSAGGALDGSMSMQLFGESTARQVETRYNNFDTDWGRYQELCFGADSVYSGYATGLDDVDHIRGYSVAYIQLDGVLQEGTDVPKRLRFDATSLVRGWHSGMWANYGFHIFDTIQYTTGQTVFADSEDATEEDRPELIVYYLYAQESSGAGGTGTIAGAGPTP